MDKKLLDFIVCPECKSSINLKVFKEDAKGRVMEGTLTCSLNNSHCFPVTSGIPRIFKSNHKEAIFDRTADVFGFEWNEFYDYSLDNLEGMIKPHSLERFNGKLGLDAGCGGGRHVVKCAKYASNIIGIDLSKAVEESNRKVQKLNNAHILQADILSLPFKKETFDFIYSLGVLHHLPEPRKGFEYLVDLLKKDGDIYVWVYKKSLRKVILRQIRRITTKLPISIIKHLAGIFSFIGYFLIIHPSRFFITRYHIFKKITPSHIIEYSKHDFRIYFTDWFDRLSAPISNHYLPGQVEEWFKKKGLSEYYVTTIGDFWCYGYGKK
ncbi:MAG: methyltransferase domain-containing protein [Candidatus Omnitrophota bacterium]